VTGVDWWQPESVEAFVSGAVNNVKPMAQEVCKKSAAIATNTAILPLSQNTVLSLMANSLAKTLNDFTGRIPPYPNRD
jgi:hypothetical protein